MGRPSSGNNGKSGCASVNSARKLQAKARAEAQKELLRSWELRPKSESETDHEDAKSEGTCLPMLAQPAKT